jgi:hypothetical protein
MIVPEHYFPQKKYDENNDCEKQKREFIKRIQQISSRSYSEFFQTLENKFYYEQRTVKRRILIAELADLSDKEKSIIIHRLAELGIEIEEGFSEKNIQEIQQSIYKCITYLEEMSDNALYITTNSPRDNTEERKRTYHVIESITEKKFLSSEKMNEALKRIKGIALEIPTDELKRLNRAFPQELHEKTLRKIKNFKDKTEEKRGPLIMQIPKKITINGEEKPLNLKTIQEIITIASKTDKSLYPLHVTCQIPEDMENETSNGNLTVWTSSCLEGTKGKSYNTQLIHQKTKFEQGNEIGINVVLALALEYLIYQEEFMRGDFMRLNAKDIYGFPLCISTHNHSIYLESSRGYPFLSDGIGASFQVTNL